MKFLRHILLMTIILTLSACLPGKSDTDDTSLPLQFSFLADLIPIPALDVNHYDALPQMDLDASAAILIHVDSGDVLFDMNTDDSLPIASMSKVMTELIVLEAIDEGKLDWEDKIDISDYAYMISHQPGFSTVELKKDGKYTVKELFTSMAVQSANGATIALAEAVSGNEKDFVALMNKKAKELELTNSVFVNSSGLTNHDLGDNIPVGKPADSNKMSAKDMATLAMYTIDYYPELMEIANVQEFDLNDKTFSNSNWMLPGMETDFIKDDVTYPGVSGLKTGFTKEAGYCFTGSVEIEGERFISVVMGAPDLADRFIETKVLYEAMADQMKQTKETE